jgi:signal transduction histidine kinase/CHASE2 domain-containing sensor protein
MLGAPAKLIREWLGLSLLLILLSGGLTYLGSLRRLDLAFFDAFTPMLHTGESAKIAVITIDDATVAALGGWPLRRELHAALIDRLTRDGASAIALDVILTDTASAPPTGDKLLAAAMTRNGKVVIPAITGTINGVATAVLPSSIVAAASFGVGNVDVHANRDGIVRSFQLVETDGHHTYNYLGNLVLQAAGMANAPCSEPPRQNADFWLGSCLRYVIGARPARYEVFSYIAVLRGEVAAESFRNRLVFIGPTASGTSTRLAAPMRNGASLSRVEFLAGTANALASGSVVTPASLFFRMAFNLGAIPLLCAALILFGPRASLLACAALAIAMCLGAIAFIIFAHVFVFPSSAILACFVAYPLWSWRRQEALLGYLTAEAQRVMDEPYLPGEHGSAPTSVDPVQRRLTTMASMVARVRRYRRFLSDWIESLPEATLVVSTLGVVVLANAKAAKFVALGTRPDSSPMPQAGRQVVDVLMDITSSPRATAFATEALNLLDERARSGEIADPTAWQFMQEIEVISARGHALLIKCAPIGATAEHDAALIFHIADVTSIRKAERQRDATLRFLSHDIRSPQASILTLVEHVRRFPTDFSDGRFIDLVERYAASALKLADDFLLLALAENQPPKLESLDLAALLADAIDDLSTLARARKITVRLLANAESAVRADANLLRRAFTNLVGNAIKFSPEGAAVVVEISPASHAWCVSIADSGPGIEEEDRQKLFDEFVRFGTDRDGAGHGLGLAFVKTAVEAMGGRVSVKSIVGVGSEFIVMLPASASASQ